MIPQAPQKVDPNQVARTIKPDFVDDDPSTFLKISESMIGNPEDLSYESVARSSPGSGGVNLAAEMEVFGSGEMADPEYQDATKPQPKKGLRESAPPTSENMDEVDLLELIMDELESVEDSVGKLKKLTLMLARRLGLEGA